MDMLSTLRKIVLEVTEAPDLPQVLNVVVSRIKEWIGVDVCSIYLADSTDGYVLMETEGLNPKAKGKVRLAPHEGLVGLVAETAEPINLLHAPDHPRYRYFPETGEEEYSSFLGVPIVHHRKVLGVLVVQQGKERLFDEGVATLLVTLAAQIAGAIAHAEVSGDIKQLKMLRQKSTDKSVKGLPGAPGVVIGNAVVIYPPANIDAVPDKRIEDTEGELAYFQQALIETREEIRALMVRMAEVLPAAEVALFDAYLLMLESNTLIEGIENRIRAGSWASAALRDTIHEHIRIFDGMDDPYLRERAQDVHDLGQRLLVNLQTSDRGSFTFPDNGILVGEDVTASMLAEVPHKKLLGVISARGSRTSHVAILARAMGIPAVMGADDLPVGRIDGHEVIVDGYVGRVFISPSDAVRVEFQRLISEEQVLSKELAPLQSLPAETTDGLHMPLYANTGLLSDISPSQNSGAEGIGLYRTEIPFLMRDRFPGEEEQRELYRQVLSAFPEQPVVIRTLDVGGDKALPYLPIIEDNPFLGWRGIRITLDHPEIFLTQLRAMFLASEGLKNLHILLPMVSSVKEVREALVLIKQAYDEISLEMELHRPKVGVMIEVPSVLYQMDALAKYVDFFSVGTNDLTQYLLAVDRNNARVAGLYDSLHPAVLRAMQDIVVRAHACGKKVSVCGEMAGDPVASLLLLGMGVDSLSMTASSLLRVKWVIRSFSEKESKQALADVFSDYEDGDEIRNHLNNLLEKKGLGGLVRAGK